jgi:hypothetical protein
MDGGDWVASFLLLRLAEAAAPVPTAENSPETSGAGALRVPGATRWGLGRGRGTGGGRPVAKRLGGGAKELRRAIKRDGGQ